MYPDTYTAGEDLVQIKAHLSKENRKKRSSLVWMDAYIPAQCLGTSRNVRSMAQQDSRHILA